ncbi:hypothetical protein MRB53_039004 [Persea americana]|nr:hypothetical protein MRB53_039004 [Persea americana]
MTKVEREHNHRLRIYAATEAVRSMIAGFTELKNMSYADREKRHDIALAKFCRENDLQHPGVRHKFHKMRLPKFGPDVERGEHVLESFNRAIQMFRALSSRTVPAVWNLSYMQSGQTLAAADCTQWLPAWMSKGVSKHVRETLVPSASQDSEKGAATQVEAAQSAS